MRPANHPFFRSALLALAAMLGPIESETLAVDLATLEMIRDAEDEQWREMGSYLAFSLSAYRSRDPMRMLLTFTPTDGGLPAEGDGRILLTGEVDPREAIGSEVLLRIVDSFEEPLPEEFLPERLPVTLVVSPQDWRPLELRRTETSEPGEEAVVRFERAEEGPAVPEGYPRLEDVYEAEGHG